VCITDLDGTLLGSDHCISSANRDKLVELGKMGIIRVLATGRSLWSLKRVIKDDDPFDFVIFSTGAGLMDWQKKELLFACNLQTKQISHISQVLEQCQMDYMLHRAIPDTHYMHYREIKGLDCFRERIRGYVDFASPLEISNIGSFETATQFVAITEAQGSTRYPKLKNDLYPLSVIKTTSPIDYSNVWFEIFAPEVSKGKTISRLLSRLSYSFSEAMVLGNDFNDDDMLCLCPNSFVVANAPQELTDRYPKVQDHDHDGFCEAVDKWLTKNT
jgi:Cof subfamily protein (haloacid dehalogenase superfamily)